jgi:prepilin-type N-terminal cleavage/methylation domain-containing protein
MTLSRRRCNSARRRGVAGQGFTLIELIFVMVIVAILAMAIVPALINFRIGRSNANTATQLIALSQFARTSAISEGRVYRLSLDDVRGTYQLFSESDAGEFVPATGDMGAPYTIDKGTRMQVTLSQAADTEQSLNPDVQQDAVQLPLPVADPTVQAPNTLLVTHRDVKDGTYVQFQPSGRCDTVQITLTDRLNSTICVGCASATDVFHVLDAGEMQ